MAHVSSLIDPSSDPESRALAWALALVFASASS